MLKKSIKALNFSTLCTTIPHSGQRVWIDNIFVMFGGCVFQ